MNRVDYQRSFEMRVRNLLLLCSLATLSVQVCECYHVLLFNPSGTKSNLIQMQPIIEEALSRGHEVTSVVFSTLGTEHQNYTEMIVPNAIDRVYAVFSKLAMEGGGQWRLRFWTEAVAAWRDSLEDFAVLALKEERVENWLKSGQKVDVVITVLPIMGAVMADLFDCPLIHFTPTGNHPFLMEGTGIDVNWSVQPLSTDLNIEPLTFFERLENHVMRNIEKLFILPWFVNTIHYYQQKRLGQNTRNPYDMIRDRLSVILSSSHPVTHGTWPSLPNYIELGGLHLRDPKLLPKDLKTFLDSATKGVVLVSFGSQFKSSEISEDKLTIFLDTFKRLKDTR